MDNEKLEVLESYNDEIEKSIYGNKWHRKKNRIND